MLYSDIVRLCGVTGGPRQTIQACIDVNVRGMLKCHAVAAVEGCVHTHLKIMVLM